MYIHQINTKKVLIVGFTSILLLMVLIAVIAISQMRLTLNSIDHIVKKNNTKTVLITTMLVTARERTISLQKIVRLSDPFDRDDEWMKFNGYGTSFASARQKFIKLGINKEEEFILKAQGLLTKAPYRSRTRCLFNFIVY